MVDHAPFFDVNRQVVLKVLNSCRIFVNQGHRRYCSLVTSREVFCVSEGHRNPRHTARIYASSINSVHREACC